MVEMQWSPDRRLGAVRMFTRGISQSTTFIFCVWYPHVWESEISGLPNMGKVKAHRVLKDMEIKGIISIEKYGKTNHITLSEDVKKLFLE